ncbi:hypothetical protein [Salibacterium aidingense]|uniref:hypothetical protein n=1 Tax=Salibacterium aidingense TaxID=384933 RepID=UPI0004006116|nr:hypothetical protein [Salibacterium aidingense]
MFFGKRNSIIIGILAVIGLFALLGDDLFTIFTILTAVLLFYAGARLLRRQTSRVMILGGIGLIILGSFVLAGWLPVFLGPAILVIIALYLFKHYKDRQKASSVRD